MQSANELFSSIDLEFGSVIVQNFLRAFDAVWTLAEVLKYTEKNRTSSEVPEDCTHLHGNLVPLDEFNYSNALMGCVIKENYKRINFTGLTV